MDSKAYQSWKENIYRPVTERERGDFATSSGFPVEPVYGPWDLEGSGEDAGLPGQYPFTRGSIRRCTGAGSGRCGSTRAFRQPRSRTGATATC